MNINSYDGVYPEPQYPTQEERDKMSNPELENHVPDPRDTQIADLQRQVAELTEQINTFKSEAGDTMRTVSALHAEQHDQLAAARSEISALREGVQQIINCPIYDQDDGHRLRGLAKKLLSSTTFPSGPSPSDIEKVRDALAMYADHTFYVEYNDMPSKAYHDSGKKAQIALAILSPANEKDKI